MATRRAVQVVESDERLLAVLARFPMTAKQAARYLGRPVKKVSERLCRLYQAKQVKRTGYSNEGRLVHVYSIVRLHAHTLRHTFLISEIVVRITEGLRDVPGYTVEFFPPGKIPLSCGLLPDITVIIRRPDGLVALWFVELDLDTERITSSRAYSLQGKLSSFAQCYDDGMIGDDFGMPGKLHSFRVALLLGTAARRPGVEELCWREEHSFIQLATLTEFLKSDLSAPVWWTSGYEAGVDFFGRRGDVPQGAAGASGAAAPVPNVSDSNDLAGAEFPEYLAGKE